MRLKETFVSEEIAGDCYAGKDKLENILADTEKKITAMSIDDIVMIDKIRTEDIKLIRLLQKEIKNRMDYRIDYVRLFTPSDEDLVIIKDDYHKIIKMIQDGKAHEISEAYTMYLSACTKSSDSSVTRGQPYSDIPAKPRAFAYKNSYMTYVLNSYIIGNKPKYETIKVDDPSRSFEDFVILSINKFTGKSIDQLCKTFNIETFGDRL